MFEVDHTSSVSDYNVVQVLLSVNRYNPNLVFPKSNFGKHFSTVSIVCVSLINVTKCAQLFLTCQSRRASALPSLDRAADSGVWCPDGRSQTSGCKPGSWTAGTCTTTQGHTKTCHCNETSRHILMKRFIMETSSQRPVSAWSEINDIFSMFRSLFCFLDPCYAGCAEL